MGFLKKLAGFFAPSTSGRFYPLTVKCNRCGEIINGEINMANDLSADESEDASPGDYYCRKVLMGSQRCFQQIEVEMRFDSNRRLIDRQITGGTFVDEQE